MAISRSPIEYAAGHSASQLKTCGTACSDVDRIGPPGSSSVRRATGRGGLLARGRGDSVHRHRLEGGKNASCRNSRKSSSRRTRGRGLAAHPARTPATARGTMPTRSATQNRRRDGPRHLGDAKRRADPLTSASATARSRSKAWRPQRRASRSGSLSRRGFPSRRRGVSTPLRRRPSPGRAGSAGAAVSATGRDLRTARTGTRCNRPCQPRVVPSATPVPR